jgi:hypothetical protein
MSLVAMSWFSEQLIFGYLAIFDDLISVTLEG